MATFSPIPDSILAWMERSWLNSFMLDFSWTWVACETLHFLGMCMLIGPIIIMDLRLLGLERARIPAPVVHKLAPLAIAGFGINAVTGIMFLFGNPHRFAVNISFQIKMGLVLLAGVNALYFWRRASPVLDRLKEHDAPSVQLKLVSVGSLLLWIGVLSFGRLIPYLGTG